MSDQMGSPDMAPPPPAAPPPAPSPSPMSSMMASMSQTDMLIAGGGALLILTDLYSIFFSYGVSGVAWVAAAAAVLMIVAKSRMPAMVMANVGTILVLAAAIVALIAVRQAIVDLRFIATPPAGVSIERLIGMAGFYVGAALMALGGWRLWKGMPA